jgi:hypothetical protein
MSIHVVCPGCKKAFTVSDQFAGKKGPCPQCKTVITVPTLKEQVTIHGPDVGPKTAEGRPIFQPIKRTETNLQPIAIFGIVAAVVTTLMIALIVRVNVKEGIPPMLLGFCAIVLGPPLAFAAYTFLRDQEGEPYRGVTLIVRSLACGLVYAVLWGAFAFVPRWAELEQPLELYWLAIVVPAMWAAGALAAYVSFDLEVGPSAVHYGFYLAITVVLLGVAGGLGMIAQLPKGTPRRGVPKPSAMRVIDVDPAFGTQSV